MKNQIINKENLDEAMKPFDLEKAKSGAPVVQCCGLPARIVDFTMKNTEYPLAVIYTDDEMVEHVGEFSADGKYYNVRIEDDRDLVMAPVKCAL